MRSVKILGRLTDVVMRHISALDVAESIIDWISLRNVMVREFDIYTDFYEDINGEYLLDRLGSPRKASRKILCLLGNQSTCPAVYWQYLNIK